jgi:hypothetical protein
MIKPTEKMFSPVKIYHAGKRIAILFNGWGVIVSPFTGYGIFRVLHLFL